MLKKKKWDQCYSKRKKCVWKALKLFSCLCQSAINNLYVCKIITVYCWKHTSVVPLIMNSEHSCLSVQSECVLSSNTAKGAHIFKNDWLCVAFLSWYFMPKGVTLWLNLLLWEMFPTMHSHNPPDRTCHGQSHSTASRGVLGHDVWRRSMLCLKKKKIKPQTIICVLNVFFLENH